MHSKWGLTGNSLMSHNLDHVMMLQQKEDAEGLDMDEEDPHELQP